MKKVLIITYHFPPDSAVGAVRPAKFAKYLPEYGWEPIIYTVKERYCESCDYSKLEPALKPLKIYRANLIPGPLNLYSRLIHNSNNSSNESLPITRAANRTSKGKSTLKRLLGSIARIPDDQQGWILNILIDAYRITKKHKIDAFVTSGPPMGTHVGGLLLKYLTHVKWVADFRDPWWAMCQQDESRYRSRLSDTVQRKLEAWTIRNADLVVSTTSSLTSYSKLILPEHQRNKCITITNGFDEDEFIGFGKSNFSRNSKITITHAGTLYFNRDPQPFFAVLNELLRTGKILKDKIEINLIGTSAGFPVRELIEGYELSSVVRLTGRIPYVRSLESLTRSDALLLFAQGQPQQIPGKVFEYLKLKKPILAITGEGETKSLLENFECAFIADPNNRDDISEKLLKMLAAIHGKKQFLDPTEKVAQFDRRNLTEMLAQSLDNLK